MTLIGSRYELGESIGQGGMGEVFKGIDTQTHTPVAIKVLKREVVAYDPDIMQRFVREGQALSKLNHPNIVKILTAIEEQDQHYIVMEYVPAGTLRELIVYQSPLPIAMVLSIGLEIADALTRAHHLRIIHRDIKPGNVLLAEDGTPRLTDFGVAMMEDMPKMTQTGAMVGTFAYLSPEACRAETIDERTDIWSFGVLLYEMLTGQNPFDKRMTAATITAILNDDPVDVRTLRPDTPAALATLIQKMLHKERTERIGSVRLVGAELEAIIRGLDTPVRAALSVEVDTDASRFATPPTNVQSLPPEAIAPQKEAPAPAEEPARPRRSSRVELPNIPVPPLPPTPPLPPVPKPPIRIDIRKAKEHAEQIRAQAGDIRKGKFEFHFDSGEGDHNTDINLGFLRIREKPDGTEDIRLGPWRFYKGPDGSERVQMGFLDFRKTADGRESFRLNPFVGLIMLAILLGIIWGCVSMAGMIL